MKRILKINNYNYNKRFLSSLEDWVPPNKIENLFKVTDGNKFATVR